MMILFIIAAVLAGMFIIGVSIVMYFDGIVDGIICWLNHIAIGIYMAVDPTRCC